MFIVQILHNIQQIDKMNVFFKIKMFMVSILFEIQKMRIK